MNLKKTVLSLFAAGSILMGGLGAVTAQTYNAETNGVINVETPGTFQPYFCSGDVDFGTVTLNSSSPLAQRTANGSVKICYTDTLNQRDTFKAYLSATDFETVYSGKTISASNLSPTTVYNPKQGQNSTDLCGPYSTTTRPCVGDIGGYTSSGARVTDSTGTPWGTGDLSSPKAIAYGWSGYGTASFDPADTHFEYWGTSHDVDLKLVVPQNAASGQYFSTLELEVIMGQQP